MEEKIDSLYGFYNDSSTLSQIKKSHKAFLEKKNIIHEQWGEESVQIHPRVKSNVDFDGFDSPLPPLERECITASPLPEETRNREHHQHRATRYSSTPRYYTRCAPAINWQILILSLLDWGAYFVRSLWLSGFNKRDNLPADRTGNARYKSHRSVEAFDVMTAYYSCSV